MVKFYSFSDFACKCGCGENNISTWIVNLCNYIGQYTEKYYSISSGYRCIKHNKEVGGVDDSAHTKGLAVDLLVNNSNDRLKVIEALFNYNHNVDWSKRIGIYDRFIHIDNDLTRPQEVMWIGGE